MTGEPGEDREPERGLPRNQVRWGGKRGTLQREAERKEPEKQNPSKFRGGGKHWTGSALSPHSGFRLASAPAAWALEDSGGFWCPLVPGTQKRLALSGCFLLGFISGG